MKKPSAGQPFVWLIGKPGMWEEMSYRIHRVLRQRPGGIFRIEYLDELESSFECEIMWDQKLQQWIRFG